MKKIVSLVISLMLCLCAFGALAEAELVPVEIEGMGVTISLPGDWNVMEITEEDVANEMIAGFASDDGAQAMLIYATALEEMTTMDAVVTSMKESYGEAEAVNINGIDICVFTAAEADMNVAAILAADGMGMYMLQFHPASDEAFATLSTQIISSIAPVAAQ